MNGMRFAWDEAKAEENRQKHGVAFEEASTVFADENARLKHDPDHSQEEERFTPPRIQREVAAADRVPCLPRE
jgi:hypothetical protein